MNYSLEKVIKSTWYKYRSSPGQKESYFGSVYLQNVKLIEHECLENNGKIRDSESMHCMSQGVSLLQQNIAESVSRMTVIHFIQT